MNRYEIHIATNFIVESSFTEDEVRRQMGAQWRVPFEDTEATQVIVSELLDLTVQPFEDTPIY